MPEPAPPSQEDQTTAPPLDGEPHATPGSPEDAAPPPTLTPKALVDMVEMGNVVGVSLVARSANVSENDPRLAEMLHFSAVERASLEALSPSAIPYVSRWLQDNALVGLLAFCGMSAIAIAKNMSGARKLGVPKKPKARDAEHDEKKEPAPSSPLPPGMYPKPPGFE